MHTKHKNKIFVLRSNRDNPWTSMGIIEDCIFDCIVQNDDFVTEIIFENKLSENTLQIQQEAEKFRCFIFFLSENLQIETIVETLRPISKLTFVIPIYGNMTIETIRWGHLHHSLQGRDVSFVVASRRAGLQLQKLVNSPYYLRLPYPVSEDFFAALPQPSLNGSIKLVYAGRITPQKNVIPMMETFLVASKTNPFIELHIAGSFHAIGYHLHGHEIDLKKFKTQFEKLISESNKKIHFHGMLDQAHLLSLYDECDYFISMSAHHDEDFGLSLAQAIARGLGGIVSDWGGHADFSKMANVRLIPMQIDENNIPQFSRKSLFVSLTELISKPSFADRTMQQNSIKTHLHQSTYRSLFKNLLESPSYNYMGQTELFLRYANLSHKHYAFNPKLDGSSHGTSIYREIYQTYLSDND